MLMLLAACALLARGCAAGYAGKELGALSELHHGVRGRAFAVDSRTLFLQHFHYDGEGPAAYFYVGTSKTPSATGALRLRDERGGAGPLRRYRGEGVTLSLPEGKTLRDVAWFAVWCDEYSINFGSVEIPRNLEYPKPAKVGALRGVHGVSSDPIVVVDAQTLLVPNFSYDGEAPDAKFWVGRGDKPSPQGIRIPDENGKEAPLRKYDRKTVVLTLPGELTVFDIGHFAVWCEAFTVNFGHVPLPRAALANVPPSLKMLGVSPQSRNKALAGEHAPPPRSRASPRKPLARLDATTYRPHLRPGPPAAQEQAAPHAQQRRADTYSPPREQLTGAPSKHDPPSRDRLPQSEDYREPIRDDDQDNSRQVERQRYEQQQQEIQLQNFRRTQESVQPVNEPNYPQPQSSQLEKHNEQHQPLEQQRYIDQALQSDNQQNHSQNEQNQKLEQQLYNQQILAQPEQETVYDQNQQLEQQLDYINQHIQAHIQRNPKVYLNNPQIQQNSQYQSDPQNQFLRTDQALSTQDLLYQQQLFEQQRRALELELQRYRAQPQPQPLQYRLLPYQYDQVENRRTLRRVDLDLVESSGSN
ncbi:ell-associated factor Eaf isoform X5 [Bicyclus anynana]|uniref:Ell-associated factor Eaf isoform X5 n=1 Tax=Bicyclus anynana TaxID=110368 RepID=A0A6J1N8P2_BICAN|nr:ell-associated factor Eaf isoform X5 [Bicyclus anynana]